MRFFGEFCLREVVRVLSSRAIVWVQIERFDSKLNERQKWVGIGM